jgi:hypothetical protein
MRTLFSTLLCLCLLVILGFGCNKDTAGGNAGNDPFLAPATAPDLPKREAGDPQQMAKEGMKEQTAADPGETLKRLTPEERAAAKRMGPGRISPQPATKNNATPVTAGTKPGAMPATRNMNKPALDYDRPVFGISKTACYGGDGCRQFSLELTNDRRLILDAKKNMDRKGKYSRLLSTTEYNRLLAAIEATEPAELSEVYPTEVKNIPADAQATMLRYPDVYGEERKVEVYYDAPEKITKLLSDLEKWVDMDGWIKMAE